MVNLIMPRPSFAMAAGGSDTTPYSYETQGWGALPTVSAAGDKTDGECRVYVDIWLFQTHGEAGVFSYQYNYGTFTWTVSIEASLQAYMSKAGAGSATIQIYAAILNYQHTEIERLVLWERDLVDYNPRSFNDLEISESETFTSTSSARYFGVFFLGSAANGATICQDSTHYTIGFPAVLTVESITWSS
jgi:hypothetical protein